jgi:hypothetical protein
MPSRRSSKRRQVWSGDRFGSAEPAPNTNRQGEVLLVGAGWFKYEAPKLVGGCPKADVVALSSAAAPVPVLEAAERGQQESVGMKEDVAVPASAPIPETPNQKQREGVGTMFVTVELIPPVDDDVKEAANVLLRMSKDVVTNRHILSECAI